MIVVVCLLIALTLFLYWQSKALQVKLLILITVIMFIPNYAFASNIPTTTPTKWVVKDVPNPSEVVTPVNIANIRQIASEIVNAMSLADGFKYQSWANANCVNWHISGICIKWSHGHPVIAPKVSMWLPVLLIETPNKFGQTNINVLKPILKAISEAGGQAGITSGGLTAYASHPLQFKEVNIVGFPLKAFEIMHPEPKYCNTPITDLFPYYISEADIINWRQGADQATTARYVSAFYQSLNVCGMANIPNNVIGSLNNANTAGVSLGNMCIGNWATLYPRVGFVDQQSEVIGSAVDAVRGASWDSYTNNQPRIDIAPIPIAISMGDKIQMAKPFKKACMYIGTNPAQWDNNVVSKTGYYAWVYWKHFTCCMF